MRRIHYTLVRASRAQRFSSTAVYLPCPRPPHGPSRRLRIRARRIHCFYVRRSMRSLVAIFTVLALAGCGDVVTTRFTTLADAKSQGAFERGWLPPLLPGSARAIVERNNLDANTGTGSFEYDVSERSVYLESLSRAGASSRAEQDADVVTVSTNGSRWEIWLLRSSGQARWNIRPL
jgi:hypothetical protein